MVKLSLALLISISSLNSYSSTLKEVDYDGFTLWLDCSEKLALMAKYEVTKDTADFQKKSYKMGKDKGCRQSSSKTYSSAGKKLPEGRRPKHQFHNGHLVPANHLDYSQTSIDESMFMDNIFPQVGRFNGSGGSWFYTEKLTECLREGTDMDVYLGLIMGDDSVNDYFLSSHGVKTPDYAWKIIHRKDTDKIQIYLMPNSYDSIESEMDTYVVGFDELLVKMTDQSIKDKLLPLADLVQDPNIWEVSGSKNLICGKYSGTMD